MSRNYPLSKYNLLEHKQEQLPYINTFSDLSSELAQLNMTQHDPSDHIISLSTSSSLEHHKSPWTFDQEQLLFQLHNRLGNKWSLIAEHFKSKQIPSQNIQKSDNSVKNHFYSKLRKALRKLNKIIQTEYKKQMKEIRQNIIYKIIEVTQLKHKKNQSQNLMQNRQNIQLCIDLKNRLLDFSYDQFDGQGKNLHTGKHLIQEIMAFIKQNRKNSKKPQSQNQLEGNEKKKSKKSSLLRQTKNYVTILAGFSSQNIFQSMESSSCPNQVRTRKSVQLPEVQQKMQNQQSRNSTPTIAQSSTFFKQQSEFFLKDMSFLDDYFLPCLPLLSKKESSTYYDKTNDEFQQFEIFENQYREESEYIMSSKDHFDDPQLDEGKFAIFE